MPGGSSMRPSDLSAQPANVDAKGDVASDPEPLSHPPFSEDGNDVTRVEPPLPGQLVPAGERRVLKNVTRTLRLAIGGNSGSFDAGGERRAAPDRVAVVVDAVVHTPSGRKFAFKSVNASAKGLLLGARVGEGLPLKIGMFCSMRLLSADAVIEFDAQLHRVTNPSENVHGFGFRIARISPANKAELDKLLVKARAGERVRARRRVGRWLVILVAVLGLAAAVVFGVRRLRRPVPIAARSATVTRGVAREFVSSPVDGEIRAGRFASVACPLDGARVASVLVHEGDAVVKGQRLAELDQQSFDRALGRARAQASLAAAQVAQAKNAQKAASRRLSVDEGLVERGAASEESLRVAKDQLTAAEDSVQVASAGLQAAGAVLQDQATDMEGRFIVAPLPGKVAALSINVGDTVAARKTVAIVLDDAELVGRVPFEDGDAPRLKIGAEAYLFVPGIKEKIPGKIRSIDAIVRIDAKGRRHVTAEIAIAGSKEGLRHGTSVNAEVLVEEHTATLLVPTASVFRCENDEKCVWVVDARSTAHTRRVKTGIVTVEQTEVVRGVEDGEVLLLDPGQAKLVEGALIAPQRQ